MRFGKNKKQSASNASQSSDKESFFSQINRVKNLFFGPALHQKMVKKATETSGHPLSSKEKQSMEKFLGEDLEHVSIHDNTESQKAADSLNAKAFTVGNQVHLGTEAITLGPMEKEKLLAHEAVHTVQQRSMSSEIPGDIQVSQPTDTEEINASSIADSYSHRSSGGYKSAGLGMRNSMRIGQVNQPVLHRDIKGFHNLPYGKIEVDFTKAEGAVVGDDASETGEVRFHPNDSAPESDLIRFIQIVKVTDVSGISNTAGQPWNYAGGDEADRDLMRTTTDSANNIAGGFFLDHLAKDETPRTAVGDADVVPFYNTRPGDGVTGKKRGTTKTAATLVDAPTFDRPLKYNFVSSAKGQDNGTWYGTALWGFEIFQDKAGVAKIRNEYKKFRQFQGETTDEAIRIFNEFYKNPGTPGAPV